MATPHCALRRREKWKEGVKKRKRTIGEGKIKTTNLSEVNEKI